MIKLDKDQSGYVIPYMTHRFVLGWSSIIGAVFAAINLSFTYMGDSDAAPEETKAASVVGFNDPVIGGLFALIVLVQLHLVYAMHKHDKLIILARQNPYLTADGDEPGQAKDRSARDHYVAMDMFLLTLAVYGIVASAVSVSGNGALSEEFINDSGTTGEMLGYFGGCAVILALAAWALWVQRNHLKEIPERVVEFFSPSDDSKVYGSSQDVLGFDTNIDNDGVKKPNSN